MKDSLLKYCAKYGLNIVSFLQNPDENETFEKFSVKNYNKIAAITIRNSIIGVESRFLLDPYFLEKSNWTIFFTNSSNLLDGTGTKTMIEAESKTNETFPVSIVIRENNSVNHFLFGHNLDHWAVKVYIL